MAIQTSNLPTINYKTYINKKDCKNNIPFGYDVFIDIGASDPRASLKMLFTTNNGDEFYHLPRANERHYVNNTKEGFVNEEDFVKKLATRFFQKSVPAIKDLIELIQSKQEREEENKLRNLILFLPGPITQKQINGINTYLARTANLKDNGKNNPEGEKKGLNDINLNEFRNLILQGQLNNASKKTEIKKIEIDDEFRFIPVKDAVGSAIGAAIALNNSQYADRLEKGRFVTVIMPGGGCTIADIMPINGHIYIKTTESAYNISTMPINGKPVRLGAVGATVRTLIRNYAEGLGINSDDINFLQKLGRTELTTSEKFTVTIMADDDNPEDTRKAIRILEDTGLYNVEKTTTPDGNESYIIQIKPEKKLSKEFREAQMKAFDKYAQVMAEIAIQKNNEEINTIILTGHLSHSIDKALKADSEHFFTRKVYDDPSYFYRKDGIIQETYFNKQIKSKDPVTNEPTVDEYGRPLINSLADLIFAKMDKYVGEHTTPNELAANNKFEIICDEQIKVADNTVAGRVLIDKNSKLISENRSNWWEIPREALNLSSTTKKYVNRKKPAISFRENISKNDDFLFLTRIK